MKFKEGNIVKVIKKVGPYIEKGAVGRVKEVREYGYLIEPVEFYEDMFYRKINWYYSRS